MTATLADRHALVAHPHTVFSVQSQRDDFLDANKTHGSLVLLVLALLKKGHVIAFTAVNTDHHDDSCLGVHSHHNGFAFDCWPLRTPRWGDWIDAGTHDFRQFLVDVAVTIGEYQVGLAGSADTAANRAAAGRTVFSDDGADHVHVGAQDA